MARRTRKPKAQKYPEQRFTHECEREGCSRVIDLRFRFCRRCAGKRARPNTDVMNTRLPGSFGG